MTGYEGMDIPCPQVGTRFRGEISVPPEFLVERTRVGTESRHIEDRWTTAGES